MNRFYAPGNFVTEGTTDKVGVTLAVADAALQQIEAQRELVSFDTRLVV